VDRPEFPRVIMVTIQPRTVLHDSYAVNSENHRPYGDAITYELIPTSSGHSGNRTVGARGVRRIDRGWEALGVQVLYRIFYNGAWASPDRSIPCVTVVNIYEDKNRTTPMVPSRRTPRPDSATIWPDALDGRAGQSHGAVLGTKSLSRGSGTSGRRVLASGGDGYPKRIWDKRTGDIDKSVADYWREHYDLVHIIGATGPRSARSFAARSRSTSASRITSSSQRGLSRRGFSESANPPGRRARRLRMKDSTAGAGITSTSTRSSRLTYNNRFIR